MNDRFKFRVWDNGNKKYQGAADWQPYLDTDGDVCFINTDDIRNYPPENYFIIEQCTGLKDKNGNLIYEGDIVCDRGEIERVCDLPLVVKWSDRLCRFMFDNEKIGMRFNLTSIDGAESHNYEIVGNIHESNKLWIHYELEQKDTK